MAQYKFLLVKKVLISISFMNGLPRTCFPYTHEICVENGTSTCIHGLLDTQEITGGNTSKFTWTYLVHIFYNKIYWSQSYCMQYYVNSNTKGKVTILPDVHPWKCVSLPFTWKKKQEVQIRGLFLNATVSYSDTSHLCSKFLFLWYNTEYLSAVFHTNENIQLCNT